MKRITFTSGISILVLFCLGFAPRDHTTDPVGSGQFLASLTIRPGSNTRNSVVLRDASMKAGIGTGQSADSRTSAAAKKSAGLSVADIIGIFSFLALIVTHFCFCRKGIYPESFALCVMSAKSKKKSAEEKEKAIG